MAKVKALRAHGNRFGDKYEKAVGDTYDNPEPQSLIDTGMVEIVDGENGKVRRAARTGGSAKRASESDGAEHAAESAEKAG